jgi:hypothetical protein
MAEALFEGITQSWHSLRWKKPRGIFFVGKSQADQRIDKNAKTKWGFPPRMAGEAGREVVLEVAVVNSMDRKLSRGPEA